MKHQYNPTKKKKSSKIHCTSSHGKANFNLRFFQTLSFFVLYFSVLYLFELIGVLTVVNFLEFISKKNKKKERRAFCFRGQEKVNKSFTGTARTYVLSFNAD